MRNSRKRRNSLRKRIKRRRNRNKMDKVIKMRMSRRGKKVGISLKRNSLKNH